MPFVLRSAALVLLALTLGALGCGGSNNKAKIAGKWRIVAGGKTDEDVMKDLEAKKGYAYCEFRDDGTMTVGLGSADPTIRDALEQAGATKLGTGRYKLLAGDGVEFYEQSEALLDEAGGPFGKQNPAKGTIRIEGDRMTITTDENPDHALKLTKLK